MKKKLRRGHGVSFSVWYGKLEEDDKQLASFLVWREFYNDNFTPEEAVIQVKLNEVFRKLYRLGYERWKTKKCPSSN